MPEPQASTRPNPKIWLSALAIVYLIGAAATAWTERPWCDEGWFAEPAWNLVRLGEMSTPTLDNSLTPALDSLKTHTYWVFPTYLVTLGGWSWIFGFSLFAARLYSTFWGGVLLVSAGSLLRSLGVRWNWVLLALGLIVVDYQFLRRASEVRMDLMCAALGMAALAFYLRRRETHYLQAIAGSHALCAAGVLTHPMGVLGYVSLLFTQLYFDRRRIRFAHLALAATPYLIGLAIWSLYILQAPDEFVSQLTENAANRGAFWSSPLSAIAHELHERYVVHIGGLGADAEWFKSLKAIGLATIVGGLAGLLFAGRAPAEARGLVRYLGWVAAIHAAGLMILDGMKLHFYVIHIAPYLLILAALAAARIWHSGGWLKPALSIWLAAHFLIQGAGAVYPMYRNSMREFKTVAAFIEPYLDQDALVMASAELGFEIGYTDKLLDDWTLGCVNGLEPSIIVLEDGYRERQEHWKSPCEAHIRQTLSPGGEYELALDEGEYDVYLRRGLEAASSAH